MKHDQLLEINIKDICIHPENCFTVKPGYIESRIIKIMDDENYDYAPVINDKCVYGLAGKKLLTSLSNEKRVLSPTIAEVAKKSYFLEIKHLSVTLTMILKKMSQSMAVLVLQTDDAERYQSISNFIGLITLSDLNCHAIRLALFRFIATLESNLVDVIIKFIPNEDDWLKKLNESDQIRILGYHELSKRNNIELKYIEATQLSNLLNIVAKTKKIIESLKYNSRNDFQNQTGKITNLRNQVMHVVRPLIIKQNDVLKLLETISFIDDLMTRLHNHALL